MCLRKMKNRTIFLQVCQNLTIRLLLDYSAQIEPLIPRQTEPLVLREKKEKFSV